MRKCPSCGSTGEETDEYCVNCGAPLPKSREIADETIAVLSLLEPREALKCLFTVCPWILDEEEDFRGAINRLYSSDPQARVQYLACYSFGVVAGLRGQAKLNRKKYAALKDILCQDRGFSEAITEQSLADLAYALDVQLPVPAFGQVAEKPKASAQSSALATDSTPAENSSVHSRASANTLVVRVVLAVLAIGLIGLIGGNYESLITADSTSSSGTAEALGSLASAGEVAASEQAEQRDDLHFKLPKGVILEMVWCPPGTFTMGSKAGGLFGFGGECGRDNDEAQHQVTLTKGFWIAKYELTQEQYAALAGGNPSGLKGAHRPVERVSWDKAVAYCQKVNRKCASSLPKGYQVNLPTEAQWEYACRAGTTTALNNGEELTSAKGICDNLDKLAWYDENSGTNTHEVGKKQANAWGLYDMHGNVWEWCSDWYGSSYGGDATDPKGPSTGSCRVGRGGSWIRYARSCRSAFRNADAPCNRSVFLGFRPACTPVR